MSTGQRTDPFEETDRQALMLAKRYLESPGFIARAADRVGRPIEAGMSHLPERWRSTIDLAIRQSLRQALEFAILSLGDRRSSSSADKWHRWSAAGSGFAGGALGILALPVELPISTTLVLRSIADISRSEGHDLRSIYTRLACLEVFALGGRTEADDGAESGYWALRAVLARQINQAARYLARSVTIDTTAPPIVRFLTAVGSRFGIVVEAQTAAKAIPWIGAIGGGSINYLFTEHFQRMARGHFIIRRLEAKYGSEIVQAVYQETVVAS